MSDDSWSFFDDPVDAPVVEEEEVPPPRIHAAGPSDTPQSSSDPSAELASIWKTGSQLGDSALDYTNQLLKSVSAAAVKKAHSSASSSHNALASWLQNSEGFSTRADHTASESARVGATELWDGLISLGKWSHEDLRILFVVKSILASLTICLRMEESMAAAVLSGGENKVSGLPAHVTADSAADILLLMDRSMIIGAPPALLNPMVALVAPAAAEVSKKAASKLTLPSLPAVGSPLPEGAPKISPGCEIATLEASENPLSFNQQFYATQTPVRIVNGITEGWDSVSLGNLQWWMETHGHRTIPVEHGRHHDGNWSESIMPLAEFLVDGVAKSMECAVGDSNAPVVYLAQHPLFNQLPTIKKMFSTPKELSFLPVTTQMTINTWFGTRGTVTPLHFDGYENILVQVAGYKYVRLYHPSETPKLYVINLSARDVPEATVGDQVKETTAQHNISAVTVESPDLETHPEFANAKYTEVVLGPGEGLYIPEKTWHYVRSLSASLSISFMF